MSKNEELELIDFVVDTTKKKRVVIEDVSDNDTPTETTPTKEKDYITRNGKKYYKTQTPYVYKCEDGFYCYRIIHKPTNTNSFVVKHIDTKEKFNTETKAKNALKDHLLKLEKDNTFKYRAITLTDIWNKIKEDSAKEEATITKYESIYKHHVSHVFGNTAIQDLSYKEINDYLEKLYKMGDGKGTGQNGYSFSFTESILKFFWLIINSAFSYKCISADDLKILTDNIQMPKNQGEKKKRILTSQEIQKVYELLKDTDYLLPYLISLYTGARPAEAFAVRFSDFDLINNKLSINKQIVEFNGILTFKPPKTFSRVVDIPNALKVEVLKRYALIEEAKKRNAEHFQLNKKMVVYALKGIKEGNDFIYDDMVMMDQYGRYNAHSSFQYYAKIIRKEICTNNDTHEDFSFYTFRKTALSIMASHSIPIGALMRITGHKKNETLFEYYYSDENEFAQRKIKESVSSMNDLIVFNSADNQS